MVAQELATGKKLFILSVSGTEAEPESPEEPAEGAAAPDALSFSAPSVASRRSSHIVMQNQMEPEEGWNVENLTEMMDGADAAVPAGAGAAAVPAKFDGVAFAKTLPGITPPLGFFDPLGFCSNDGITEGKIKFYREVELKHGRVSMLAALGFLVGENFHPLFGGNIDVPSYIAFQETPLQTFWGVVVLAIAVPEVFSVFSFRAPSSETWAIRQDYELGDLGFDPLGLKPTDPAELKEMQTKELNNGRLAMIAIAGMVAQELATGNKIFMLSVGGQEISSESTRDPADPAVPTPAAPFDGLAYAQTLPGITAPLGFFDPLGFCSKDDITEGKIKFYREVELKHGRVSMLAALGFLVGENFHPLFG